MEGRKYGKAGTLLKQNWSINRGSNHPLSSIRIGGRKLLIPQMSGCYQQSILARLYEVDRLPYSDDELNDIYDKNDGYCWHCGKKLAFTNYGIVGARGAWEVEHSNPLANGGSNYFRNLVPSCIPCNRSKGTSKTRQFSY